MIKSPCTRDCAERAPGCHSEKCPHGWLDYEAERNRGYKDRMERLAASADTVSDVRRRRKIKQYMGGKIGK